MNTKLHTNDAVFALNDGLLPISLSKVNVREQFIMLGETAGISSKLVQNLQNDLTSKEEQVGDLIAHSYLSQSLNAVI